MGLTSKPELQLQVLHLQDALLCRIRLPAGYVGIIEKQFAGEVYGGKVVHLTKPKKKSNR